MSNMRVTQILSIVACLALNIFNAAAQTLQITPEVITNTIGQEYDNGIWQGQIYTNIAGQSLAMLVTGVDTNDQFSWSRNDLGTQSGPLPAGDGQELDFTFPPGYEGTNTFSVQVTGTNGSTDSIGTTVYTVAQPTILMTLQTATNSDDVTFHVDAAGGLLSYQWFWCSSNYPQYAIAGATNDTLTYTNAFSTANAGYYWVFVSNPAGVASSPTNSLLFTKPAPSGTYQGVFYNPDIAGVTSESSGYFTFTIISTNRGVSGKILNGLNTCSFAGKFEADHSAFIHVTNTATRKPIFELQLQLLTAKEHPQVRGMVTGSGFQGCSRLFGNRVGYSSKSPCPYEGTYTVSIQPTPTNNYMGRPDGSGYGTIIVQKAGTATLAGEAADGTSIIPEAAAISEYGDFPFYVSMYSGRGVMVGWLNFIDNGAGIIGPSLSASPFVTYTISDGVLTTNGALIAWTKLPGADSNYTNGFAPLPCVPVGSSYVSNVKPEVLDFTNLIATLWGGDLITTNSDDPGFTNSVLDFVQVTQTRPNIFTVATAEKGTEKLTLRLNKTTGVMTGSYVDYYDYPALQVLIDTFKGVVLPLQGYAAGFFLNPKTSGLPQQSGSFVLAPDSFLNQ